MLPTNEVNGFVIDLLGTLKLKHSWCTHTICILDQISFTKVTNKQKKTRAHKVIKQFFWNFKH